MWSDGHVDAGVQNNGKMSLKFFIIIESKSKKIIVLYTNMAAVTARENHEFFPNTKPTFQER